MGREFFMISQSGSLRDHAPGAQDMRSRRFAARSTANAHALHGASARVANYVAVACASRAELCIAADDASPTTYIWQPEMAVKRMSLWPGARCDLKRLIISRSKNIARIACPNDDQPLALRAISMRGARSRAMAHRCQRINTRHARTDRAALTRACRADRFASGHCAARHW